jgi:hypothetical protein
MGSSRRVCRIREDPSPSTSRSPRGAARGVVTSEPGLIGPRSPRARRSAERANEMHLLLDREQPATDTPKHKLIRFGAFEEPGWPGAVGSSAESRGLVTPCGSINESGAAGHARRARGSFVIVRGSVHGATIAYAKRRGSRPGLEVRAREPWPRTHGPIPPYQPPP